VETRVDKGKGTVATLIVKRGTIRIGTELYDGSEPIVRVRGMFDDAGRPVREAGPSTPVEVMGFRSQPAVGSLLTAEPADRLGAAQARTQQAAKPRLPDFLKPMDEEKEMLKVVLKADTAGSLEAIVQSLGDRVTLVGGGVGDIAEADVFLAKTSSAIIVGFNVNISSSVQMLAQTEKVVLRTYRIIYKLIEEIEEVILGLREVTTGERELGKGEIIAEFPFDKHRIAGTKVVSGRLSRGDFVRVMRAETEVGRAKIRTLRQGKEDINRAQLGSECGVLLDYAVDFQLGDAIIAVTTG
jgi:translation initiation factor IF-2